MSWSGYVENLMGTKHMTDVGIFGLDGAVWASSANFPLSPENVKTVIASVSDTAKAGNGLTVGQDRFILVRIDPGVSLLLKKGASGLVAYKSTQSIIIALHDHSIKAEVVLTDIGRVIDYMSRYGF